MANYLVQIMNITTGTLIEFSGVDGAGKSTQAKLLAQALISQGYECVVQDTYQRYFYDTTKTALGIDGSLRENFTIETAEVLMICDEILHYERVVLPLLRRGVTVISARSISDRYTKAVLFNAENAEDINKLGSMIPEPNLHFFLRVNQETAMQRIIARGTDKEDPAIMQRYVLLSNKASEFHKWISIDGNRSRYEIHSEILNIAINHINKNGALLPECSRGIEGIEPPSA